MKKLFTKVLRPYLFLSLSPYSQQYIPGSEILETPHVEERVKIIARVEAVLDLKHNQDFIGRVRLDDY